MGMEIECISLIAWCARLQDDYRPQGAMFLGAGLGYYSSLSYLVLGGPLRGSVWVLDEEDEEGPSILVPLQATYLSEFMTSASEIMRTLYYVSGVHLYT